VYARRALRGVRAATPRSAALVKNKAGPVRATWQELEELPALNLRIKGRFGITNYPEPTPSSPARPVPVRLLP